MASFKCQHHRSFTEVKMSIKTEIPKMFDPLNMMHPFRSSSPPLPRLEEPMGTKFTRPPYGYPSSGEHYRTVNEILHISLCHQREEDISDCSGFISYVVSLCLKAVNITNCRLDSGNRRLGSNTNPHMWLVICEIVIDNYYSKQLTNEEISLLLEKKHPKSYESTSYSYSHSDLKSIDRDIVLSVKTRKMIDLFKKDPLKAMALCLNREDLSNYFFAMVRFMWEKYKVNIAGVDPCIRYFCWQCGKLPPLSDMLLNDIFPEKFNKEDLKSEGASGGGSSQITTSSNSLTYGDDTSASAAWKFPVCGHCKIASYCCRTCQSSNWKEDHKFTCRTRSSVCFLPSDCPD